MSEIRIYVEGGGDGADTKAAVRQGFGQFLRELVAVARSQRTRWCIIACGGRNSTFEGFRMARDTHWDAFNVLLVDSEGPVNSAVCQHLRDHDGWTLDDFTDQQCHLMVQLMEAWIIVDIAALRQFYGHGFQRTRIPRNPNVEEIDKDHLLPALRMATQHTSKGEYHKVHHGPKLLALVDPSQVRSVGPHCDRLFRLLRQKIVG